MKLYLLTKDPQEIRAALAILKLIPVDTTLYMLSTADTASVEACLEPYVRTVYRGRKDSPYLSGKCKPT